jgi:hypothetical protein
MEAPEKIWAHVNGRTADQNWESFGEYLAHGSQTNKSEYVEYTRSDIADQFIRKLEAENSRMREALGQVRNWLSDVPASDFLEAKDGSA